MLLKVLSDRKRETSRNRRMDGRKCHDNPRIISRPVQIKCHKRTNEQECFEHERTVFMTRTNRKRIVDALHEHWRNSDAKRPSPENSLNWRRVGRTRGSFCRHIPIGLAFTHAYFQKLQRADTLFNFTELR